MCYINLKSLLQLFKAAGNPEGYVFRHPRPLAAGGDWSQAFETGSAQGNTEGIQRSGVPEIMLTTNNGLEHIHGENGGQIPLGGLGFVHHLKGAQQFPDLLFAPGIVDHPTDIEPFFHP